MAIISSHTLNSVDGTHAGGVSVRLFRLDAAGNRTQIFETATDEGGRLSETVDLTDTDAGAEFELVFATGRYFASRQVPISGMQILHDVVIRFTAPDPDAKYHIPLMLAPNSYSAWFSS